MKQLPFDVAGPTSENKKPTQIKQRGPINRMNDLDYTTWMKFQKSFFRDRGLQNLVSECINFFTKATWPDGRMSRTLLVGFDAVDTDLLNPGREVIHIGANTTASITQILSAQSMAGEQFDFVLIDFLTALSTNEQLDIFLRDEATDFFGSLRALTIPDRYCGVLVGLPGLKGGGFPIPWSVGMEARRFLKLRDEKIGLVERAGSLFYCLFMQSVDDERTAEHFYPSSIKVATEPATVPSWIIPKPPPRTRRELLHPAKFPETLVRQFVEVFTKSGDTVFDPMMGTGSAVLAAIESGRNGIGLDLSPTFVALARQRLEAASSPRLFQELNPLAQWSLYEGDATNIGVLPEISNQVFDYCITSPPYWSMLSNPGSEGQRSRRNRNLPLVYSDNKHDLGNVTDYDTFLDLLVKVYTEVCERLAPHCHLTVIVKNVKKDHVLYTLAWDLTIRLAGVSGCYDYVGTTLWCQDDINLKPFAVGTHWVSNILHQYCLHFRKRG